MGTMMETCENVVGVRVEHEGQRKKTEIASKQARKGKQQIPQL